MKLIGYLCGSVIVHESFSLPMMDIDRNFFFVYGEYHG